MSRSIETPRDAVVACYRDIRNLDLFDWEEEWEEEWEEYEGWIIETACAMWPSLSEDHSLWLTNETRVLCSNELGQITVSVYAGLCCIALVPIDLLDGGFPEDNSKHNLALHWCNQVSNKFNEAFKQYTPIRTASNGETFYEKVKS